MRLFLRALLTVGLALAGLVALTTPASAAYQYTSTAEGRSVAGVRFYTVVEYDPATKHVRAKGVIDALDTSNAGRLQVVVLDRYTVQDGGAWRIAARTPVGSSVATNNKDDWPTGPVGCTPGTRYRARIDYHIDGTSAYDGYLYDYSPTLTCG